MLDKDLVKVVKTFIWRSPVHNFWYRIFVSEIEEDYVHSIWEELSGMWETYSGEPPKIVHPNIVQSFNEFITQNHVYPMEKSKKTFKDFL